MKRFGIKCFRKWIKVFKFYKKNYEKINNLMKKVKNEKKKLVIVNEIKKCVFNSK